MFRKLVALTALTLGCAGLAAADTLNPTPQTGMEISPVPMLNPNGVLLASTGGTLTAPTFTGTYTAAVYRDMSNVFGPGNLDFLYTFTHVSGDSVERITVGNFNGFGVQAGVLTFNSAGTILPEGVSFAKNGAVGFYFNGDPIGDGSTSQGLLVETNAMDYMPGTFSAQDNTTANAIGYQPVASTPEPTSLALFGTGLLGVVGVARRKFNV